MLVRPVGAFFSYLLFLLTATSVILRTTDGRPYKLFWYHGESLIYISFPIGICVKRVPVHSYPFPYLNPLPTAVRESVRLSAFI